MRAKRKPYIDMDDAQAAPNVHRLHNLPEQKFNVGDKCALAGMQTYKVQSVEWNSAAGDYLVHGRYGCMKFWMWQGDVRRV